MSSLPPAGGVLVTLRHPWVAGRRVLIWSWRALQWSNTPHIKLQPHSKRLLVAGVVYAAHSLQPGDIPTGRNGRGRVCVWAIVHECVKCTGLATLHKHLPCSDSSQGQGGGPRWLCSNSSSNVFLCPWEHCFSQDDPKKNPQSSPPTTKFSNFHYQEHYLALCTIR